MTGHSFFEYVSGTLLAGEAGVGAVTYFGEFLGEAQELLGSVREQLVKGCETNLSLEEVLELGPVWLLGVESERILSFGLEGWVVPVEVPVTAVNGKFLLLLAQTHTSLQTVVDARSVGDDQGWTVVGLSLLYGVEVLCRACTHGHLCDIDIAIADGHHAEILLADLLA